MSAGPQPVARADGPWSVGLIARQWPVEWAAGQWPVEWAAGPSHVERAAGPCHDEWVAGLWSVGRAAGKRAGPWTDRVGPDVWADWAGPGRAERAGRRADPWAEVGIEPWAAGRAESWAEPPRVARAGEHAGRAEQPRAAWTSAWPEKGAAPWRRKRCRGKRVGVDKDPPREDEGESHGRRRRAAAARRYGLEKAWGRPRERGRGRRRDPPAPAYPPDDEEDHQRRQEEYVGMSEAKQHKYESGCAVQREILRDQCASPGHPQGWAACFRPPLRP
ncbi:hypothetical protein LIER_43896 [Lithospermum erythrorhizon]|uniref:Uncharacterized protein n=1 Tax=Lithospermum erythrorhizon TaxID=34254 RepID=A0AAV3R7M1_LITER